MRNRNRNRTERGELRGRRRRRRRSLFQRGSVETSSPGATFDSPLLSGGRDCRFRPRCKPRIQQADRDESISDRMSREPSAAIRLRLPRPPAALFLDRTHCFLCRKLVDINHCLRHRQLNFAYLYRYRHDPPFRATPHPLSLSLSVFPSI